MAQLTLTEAQRILLGILTSVESGVTSPEDGLSELSSLKARALTDELPFKSNYTLDDLKKIRENHIATYDTSTPVYESSEPYESSEGVSY